jgi:hypothetical protein
MGYLNITYKLNADLLKWFLLPTIGYLITLGLNSFIQSVSCGKVKVQQIAMGSLSVPIAIFFFLLLTLSSWVRSPVEMAVPFAMRAKYAGLLAVGFYMFWAGMFGESVASGFAQSCPVA